MPCSPSALAPAPDARSLPDQIYTSESHPLRPATRYPLVSESPGSRRPAIGSRPQSSAHSASTGGETRRFSRVGSITSRTQQNQQRLIRRVLGQHDRIERREQPRQRVRREAPEVGGRSWSGKQKRVVSTNQATGFEHANDLAGRRRRIDQVLEDLGADHRVNRLVRERQVVGVADQVDLRSRGRWSRAIVRPGIDSANGRSPAPRSRMMPSTPRSSRCRNVSMR